MPKEHENENPVLKVLRSRYLPIDLIISQNWRKWSEPKESTLPLLHRLTDSDFRVRLKVARALGHLGDGRAVEPLIACVRNEQEEDDVRAVAARSLGDLGDARAVEAPIPCLQRSDEGLHQIAAAAAEALGRPGDRRGVESLLSCGKAIG